MRNDRYQLVICFVSTMIPLSYNQITNCGFVLFTTVITYYNKTNSNINTYFR